MPHFASAACVGIQTAKATLTCAARCAPLVAVARAGVNVVEVFQEQVSKEGIRSEHGGRDSIDRRYYNGPSLLLISWKLYSSLW